MKYDFIPPFIDKEITLTVCRISGSEKDAFVNYSVTFPDGLAKTILVAKREDINLEYAEALWKAADTWFYLKQKENDEFAKNAEKQKAALKLYRDTLYRAQHILEHGDGDK